MIYSDINRRDDTDLKYARVEEPANNILTKASVVQRYFLRIKEQYLRPNTRHSRCVTGHNFASVDEKKKIFFSREGQRSAGG